MVNLLACAILIVLVVTFLCVTKKAICESFTNHTDIGHLEFDDPNNHENTLEYIESESSSDDEEDIAEASNDDAKTQDVEDDNIESKESVVDDTIVIKDTIRQNSKVPSSLHFTYIDEQCGNIVKDEDVQPDFPIEKVKSKPITPMVNFNNRQSSWDKSACKVSGPSHLTATQKFKNEENFHSEMFDDSELKPKPEVDSPYGFVYFPNKYWKQWHRKPPVCTPTDKCKILPTYTQGTPVDVLDYTQLGSIMPKFEYQEEYENSCK